MNEQIIVYLAAPLFSCGERYFNLNLSDALKTIGKFQVILPQEFSGNYEKIFQNCLDGILNASVVVAILDGADHDSGTLRLRSGEPSLEIGYALALRKRIIGIRTDFRNSGDMQNGCNLMIFHSCHSLINYNPEITEKISSNIFDEIVEEILKVLS